MDAHVFERTISGPSGRKTVKKAASPHSPCPFGAHLHSRIWFAWVPLHLKKKDVRPFGSIKQSFRISLSTTSPCPFGHIYAADYGMHGYLCIREKGCAALQADKTDILNKPIHHLSMSLRGTLKL